jgi:hypothetical protein
MASGRTGDAAIYVVSRPIASAVCRSCRGEDFVWAEWASLALYGCYISPHTGMDAFRNFLEELGRAVGEHRIRGKQVLVTGDFNEAAPDWGSEREGSIAAGLDRKLRFVRNERRSSAGVQQGARSRSLTSHCAPRSWCTK